VERRQAADKTGRPGDHDHRNRLSAGRDGPSEVPHEHDATLGGALQDHVHRRVGANVITCQGDIPVGPKLRGARGPHDVVAKGLTSLIKVRTTFTFT
jgi:hypothetical protein